MSTRSTILYLMEPDGSFVQHWHAETNNNTVEIEIDHAAILECSLDEEGLSVTLKPDSKLAQLLRHREVIALFRRLSD